MPDQCFLCKRVFDSSRDGKFVSAWRAHVCFPCLGASWDGVDPAKYPHLEPHLRANGITPEYNALWRIDIPSSDDDTQSEGTG